jgi:hypothetical protein
VLLITGHSLGNVTVGMTMAQAARAAGVPAFELIGDGVSVPTTPNHLLTEPDLYLSTWAGTAATPTAFSCVGAALGAGTSVTGQVIMTPDGVHLGDPPSRVTAVYGARAKFVPMPTTGGMDPRAGYIVAEQNYDLVFKLNDQGDKIIAIVGGLAPLTPSECGS